jgi:hypothetical protein
MSATAIKLRKALAANSTATAFVEQEPSATAPSGTGVWDLLDREIGWGAGVKVPSYLQLIFFGAGSDTQTFDCRVWGYNATNDSTTIYIPQLLADVTCALGPTTGCDGAAIAASTLMVDSITVNQGSADGGFRNLVNSADDTTASLLLHCRGCRWIKLDFDMTGATSGNAYIRPVE